MSKLNYYILDTETTGLKAGYHEVHELSIIRVKDKVQLTKDILCSYPQRSNYEALKLTSKTMKDLTTIGSTRLNVVNSANTFFEQDGNTADGRVIVAYNGAFDRRFVHALWKQCNKNFPASLWLDPLQIMRKYAKDQGWGKVKLGLGPACDKMGIKKFSAHTAEGDTRRTYFLYKKLIDELGLDYLSFIKTERQAPVEQPTGNNYTDEDMSILDDMEF